MNTPRRDKDAVFILTEDALIEVVIMAVAKALPGASSDEVGDVVEGLAEAVLPHAMQRTIEHLSWDLLEIDDDEVAQA